MTSACNTERVTSFDQSEASIEVTMSQSEYLNPFQKWKVMGTESRNLSEKRMGEPIWRSWIIFSTEAKLPENNMVNVQT